MGTFQGRRTQRFGVWVASVLMGLVIGEAAAGGWTLVDIGTLGGPGSYGAAVSNSGVVVGCSDVMPVGVHAFVYRDGAMQDLGTGGDSTAGNSCALAVNRSGMVAGRSASGELVVWNGSSVTRLGVRGDVGDMNDAGIVVGSYLDSGQSRAFMFKDGVLTDLGTPGVSGSYSVANSINAKGDVVGTSNGRAFLYANGAMRDLGTLGGNRSVAKGINDRGQVVGMSSNDFGQPVPFIYDGTMQALPGGNYATAVAINDRVQIVVTGEGRGGHLVADGNVTPLDSLPAVQAKGWRRLEPTGINDQGWIVGTGTDAEGNFRAFLLIPRAPTVLASQPLAIPSSKPVSLMGVTSGIARALVR